MQHYLTKIIFNRSNQTMKQVLNLMHWIIISGTRHSFVSLYLFLVYGNWRSTILNTNHQINRIQKQIDNRCSNHSTRRYFNSLKYIIGFDYGSKSIMYRCHVNRHLQNQMIPNEMYINDECVFIVIL